MDEQLIIEVWDTFKDYIPEKNRETAANQYVDFLINKDIELTELQNVMGYDSHLDSAIEFVIEEYKDDADDEENEDWDYKEDEE